MRFRIGLDGLADRPLRAGDAAAVVVSEADLPLVATPDAASPRQLDAARTAGADAVLVAVGRDAALERLLASAACRLAAPVRRPDRA